MLEINLNNFVKFRNVTLWVMPLQYINDRIMSFHVEIWAAIKFNGDIRIKWNCYFAIISVF